MDDYFPEDRLRIIVSKGDKLLGWETLRKGQIVTRMRVSFGSLIGVLDRYGCAHYIHPNAVELVERANG